MVTKRTIPAGEFKAKCLAILNEVAAGAEIVVTKRGKPVARLVPPGAPERAALREEPRPYSIEAFDAERERRLADFAALPLSKQRKILKSMVLFEGDIVSPVLEPFEFEL